MKIVSFWVIIAMMVSGSTAYAFGQTSQTKADKVKEKVRKLGLGERTRVTVKLNNDSTFKGFVSEANTDDFVIVDKAGNSHKVRYSDVESIGGRNFSTGAKIAVGIGIGVGAVFLALYLIFRNER